jgi:WhiB family redox-sensing transcriptional regulator
VTAYMILPKFPGKAACAGKDAALWFPQSGGITAEAKRICDGCELREACLKWSIDNREPYGTWAEVSETQRRELLKRRRSA